MGTRNLTMVISNGQTKIAQYGQWDGYPGGQGATALDFLRNTDLEIFKKKLEIVRFETEVDSKEKENYLKKLGASGGWVTMEQGNKYDKKYPLDSRDHGAGILKLIMDSTDKEIVLVDSTSFAADSLFCEYAYVIDLDKNTFEVYEGFNQTPLPETERFYSLQGFNKERKEKYFPVKLAKSYPLDNLPTEEEFIKYFEPVEED